MARRPKPPVLAVVTGGFPERAEPPTELTKRQAVIWREVVASEPVDWFQTAVTRHLLADYCRHREAAELVDRVITGFKPEWVKSTEGLSRFRTLCLARQSETRAATFMATKLRLTNQSRRTKGATATAASHTSPGARPWEPDGAA